MTYSQPSGQKGVMVPALTSLKWQPQEGTDPALGRR